MLPQNQDPDRPNWTWRPYNDDDCIITIEEFIIAVGAGEYTDDDGYGECATATHVSSERIYVSNLDRYTWTTHVCWHNK
jgi:hypothetical protein